MAVALFVFGLLPAGSVRAAAAPIQVQGCSVDEKWRAIDVDFANTGSQDITNIRFAIMTASGPVKMMDDAGAFSPGATMHHRLRYIDDSILALNAQLQCVPVSIAFKDGTAWENPTLPADMEKALPQTAGSNVAISKCYVSDQVYVSYKNTAEQDAKKIDLGLVQHGLIVWKMSDTGTFSPNTLIEHSWSITGAGVPVSTDLLHDQCIVLGVQYADGTSWTNTAAPQADLKGIPMDAPSPAANAPISVLDCHADRDYAFGTWRVQYRNDSQKQETAADFGLIIDGRLVGAGRDLHSLAPGDAVTRHSFWYVGGIDGKNPTCVPLRANYADGTTWINPLLHIALP